MAGSGVQQSRGEDVKPAWRCGAYWLLLLALSVVPGEPWARVCAVAPRIPAGADAAWAWVNENTQFEAGLRAQSDETVVLRLMYERERRFRERGLEFWLRFARDERRWRWLEQVLNRPLALSFWKDVEQGARAYARHTPEFAPVDLQAEQAWRTRYVALRAEFMAARAVDEARKNRLRGYEISGEIARATRVLLRGEKVDISMLQNSLLDLAGSAPDNSMLRLYASRLTRAAWLADPASEPLWISAMKHSVSSHVRYVGEGAERLAARRTEPLELNVDAVDGRPIDLRQLRGKLVLVMFWSIHCPDCIAEMPVIAEVYRRYRDRGFEVIGVCGLNAAEEQDRALRIIREQQVPWPQWMPVGEAWDAYSARYGFVGVPVTWLLDTEGLLVETDTGVLASGLEALVKRHLPSRSAKAGWAPAGGR